MHTLIAFAHINQTLNCVKCENFSFIKFGVCMQLLADTIQPRATLGHSYTKKKHIWHLRNVITFEINFTLQIEYYKYGFFLIRYNIIFILCIDCSLQVACWLQIGLYIFINTNQPKCL